MPELNPQPDASTSDLTPQDHLASSVFDEIERLQQLPESPENWDRIIELQKELQKIYEIPEVKEAIPETKTEQSAEAQEQIKQWQQFYKETFNTDIDPTQIKIPERTAEQEKEFTRLIIVAEGMTPQRLFDKCKTSFDSWTNLDLAKITTEPNRAAQTSPYAVWVRDTQEADEENKNKSADNLKSAGEPGITLEERLLYELKYFKETNGKHLDDNNWTLCTGSRHAGGYVPSVYWDDDGLKISWYSPGYSFGDIRSRSVVF